MSSKPDNRSPIVALGASALSKTLAQNEQAEALVADAAEELSSINVVLQQELAEKHPPPGLEKVIEKMRPLSKNCRRLPTSCHP